MKVTPELRRAVHQAADLILDALSADAHDTKQTRRRGPTVRPLPAPVELSPELQAQLDRQLKKAGYRKR